MISNCPHCQGTLKFNAAQLEKIEQALKALKPGKRLPLKCPHCKKPMQLDAAGEVEGAAAPKKGPEKAAAKAAETKSTAIKPPPPPPLDFLEEKQGVLWKTMCGMSLWPWSSILMTASGISWGGYGGPWIPGDDLDVS